MVQPKMLQNRLHSTPINMQRRCWEDAEEGDRVYRREQMNMWKWVKFFCADTLLESKWCADWKAAVSELVSLLIKVWLIRLPALVKLSQILCRSPLVGQTRQLPCELQSSDFHRMANTYRPVSVSVSVTVSLSGLSWKGRQL